MIYPFKMKILKNKKSIPVILFLTAILSFACKRSFKMDQKTSTIVLASSTSLQEVYQKGIIPAFQDYWFKKTDQKVEFKESYSGSRLQVQSIMEGLEADVAALALEEHIEILEEAGLITHSWHSQSHRGIVARSLVAFALREGNPKDIFTWESLTQQEINLIHADPKTSGTGQWVASAIYGAGLKLTKGNSGRENPFEAKRFLQRVEKNLRYKDLTSRSVLSLFNQGTGDVLISSEHEIKFQQRLGRAIEMIIPAPTIWIEYPVALIDQNVDHHGNREVVEAFVKFLWSGKAQDLFASYGLRAVDEMTFEEYAIYFSKPQQVFDVRYLGGWKAVQQNILNEY